MVLATNNGSLYVLSNFRDILLFASERYILEQVCQRQAFIGTIPGQQILQVKPNSGYLLDLSAFHFEPFRLSDPSVGSVRETVCEPFSIKVTPLQHAETKQCYCEGHGGQR